MNEINTYHILRKDTQTQVQAIGLIRVIERNENVVTAILEDARGAGNFSFNVTKKFRARVVLKSADLPQREMYLKETKSRNGVRYGAYYVDGSRKGTFELRKWH